MFIRVFGAECEEFDMWDVRRRTRISVLWRPGKGPIRIWLGLHDGSSMVGKLLINVARHLGVTCPHC